MDTRVSTATRVRVGTQHQQVARLVSRCDSGGWGGGGQFPSPSSVAIKVSPSVSLHVKEERVCCVTRRGFTGLALDQQ